MAKANRVSKKIVTGITTEAFNAALNSYATADACNCKTIARMDAEITRIREKYADDLDRWKQQEEAQFEIIEAYCKENKNMLFTERRSIATVHGTIGFRLGTPKLKTLPKWTWEKAIDKIRAIMPEYLRRHEEIDKEGIIRDRMEERVSPHLNEAGIYVTQDEHFFIELKKEE